MNIADRIQQLRKSKGISQEQLADAIGVSRQAVSKWESEQSLPDLDKIILLSDYFEITSDYLLKGIEPLPPQAPAEEKRPLNALLPLACFLVWVGYLSSCALWYEYQNAWALLNGFVWMAGGYAVIQAAVLAGRVERKALSRFWKISLWPMAVFALSLVYNALCGWSIPAPYPLAFGPLGWDPDFALIGLSVLLCAAVAGICWLIRKIYCFIRNRKRK